MELPSMVDKSAELTRFSVVVNTDGRVGSLIRTLDGLRQLRDADFEICVVYGPTLDGTKEAVENYGQGIKFAHCSERNLSMSRNIGIAMAAGTYVAFIDDDAYPDPRWLSHLSSGYSSDRIGGTGGLVYDHTGFTLQYKYSTANRLGNSDWKRSAPASEYNFALSYNFPYLQGTNCSFRRNALIEIGGFDEEIEFYLDETDVCCRLIDAGYEIAQLDKAFVYHKFLPSHIRNEHRVTKHRYAVIKNKIYFSLVNNRGHCEIDEVLSDAREFIVGHEKDIYHHIEGGRLEWSDLSNFRHDVNRAWERGLREGLAKNRKLLTSDLLTNYAKPYLRFKTVAGDKPVATYCFLCQDYPPKHVGGIARYTHHVATAIAALGHEVHVLTRGEGFSRVDFEEGVWVHRVNVRHMEQATRGDNLLRVPQHIWDYSACMLGELVRISILTNINAVEAPIWDCEGIAVLTDGRFPLVTSLHTTLALWLESHPEHRNDPDYMSRFGDAMLAAETKLFRDSALLHANSDAIVAEIRRLYPVALEQGGIATIPHGMNDLAAIPSRSQIFSRTLYSRVRVLFVGRLERRKGIDVLLAAAVEVLRGGFPAEFLVVGDDSIPSAEGITYRRQFEQEFPELISHVKFAGRVDEDSLRAAYAQSDVFVAPSRFESFGLIAVEAMMFSLPIIASSAGGLKEIIREDNGILVDPEDVGALAKAIVTLISNASMRADMGTSARKSYESRFSSSRMAEALSPVLYKVRRERCFAAWQKIQYMRTLEILDGQLGYYIEQHEPLKFSQDSKLLAITFFMHDWSGIVEVSIGNEVVERRDLYSDVPRLCQISINCLLKDEIQIRRIGERCALALDTEVILVGVYGSVETLS